ncbi:unnamed protein product [Ascophyllum nodosum]
MAAFKNHRGQGRSGAAVAILFLASAPGNSQPFLFLSGIGGSSSAGSSRAEPWSMTLGETPGTGPGAGFLRGRRFPTLLASVGPGGQPSRDGETLGASWGTDRSQRSRRRRLGWGQVKPASVRSVKRCGSGKEEPGALSGAAAGEAAASVTGAHEEATSADSCVDPSTEVDRVPSAGELLVKARDLYHENFGQPKDVSHVCAGYAPGRVNLIGEHTDYNGGFVMPLALERGTVVYGVGRVVDAESGSEAKGGLCQIVSESMLSEESGGSVSFQADESLVPGKPEWANYVKGVVKEFMVKVPAGKCLEFTAVILGAVPIGGGVSSSASLTVATATFLEGILSTEGITPPSPKEKAHLCRMAEHRFLDMPCGIMDQFVTSMAVPGHAMLLDCRSEEPDAVPLSDSNLVVVVTNSNVKHNLAGSQYSVRVSQCDKARDEVKKRHPDVDSLRDASPEQVEEIKGRVEDAVFRRARHVVSENTRTVEAARALIDRDYPSAGRLMLESHQSLREDFEVSCPEIDTLVELAMEVEGVYGSRLTGGGFGGCTVTLVDKDAVDGLVRHLQEGYSRAVGRECSCFVTKPGFGARGLTGSEANTGTMWPDSS